jgi:hypothetical protein
MWQHAVSYRNVRKNQPSPPREDNLNCYNGGHNHYALIEDNDNDTNTSTPQNTVLPDPTKGAQRMKATNKEEEYFHTAKDEEGTDEEPSDKDGSFHSPKHARIVIPQKSDQPTSVPTSISTITGSTLSQVVGSITGAEQLILNLVMNEPPSDIIVSHPSLPTVTLQSLHSL